MSSRVLKKLRGDDLELQQSDNTNDIDDEDVEYQEKQFVKNENGKKQNQNIFELLNQQSLSDSETKEDSTEIEQTQADVTVDSSTSNAAKKRRRKKKSKSKVNTLKSKEQMRTNKHLSNQDPLLDKVSEATKYNTKLNSTTSKDGNIEPLLTVELKHLNPQNEMRRTFGKRVVKMDNKRSRQKITLKTTYIVTAKETWPPVTKNIISMKLTIGSEAQLATSSQSVLINGDNSNGAKLHWFEFEHSPYYQNIQNMFLSALERTDSDFLINLIWRCPHHVDSLIQLSELCKMTEDFYLAAELIERAVLVLESSLHPNFSLTNGMCRLDYKLQRNRAFFIALFKHAQYLEARACCRTAFEISKLLLNLNPGVDPLAMILVLDYYALRCKQYKWLIDFYEKYDTVRNLSQLPNMAYSYALALFCLEGESEASDRALEYALLMFPSVLKPLLDELSVQTDKRVLISSYFNSGVSNNQAPALHQLVCLYICRAKNIWRQSNILPWLERNVNAALDRVDNNDEILEEYRMKRISRYLQPPRPVLRHVILSDFKEKVPLAPFIANEEDAIMIYDPLPPRDSIDFYERKPNTSTSTQTRNGQVSGFFRSLLPTYRTRQQQQRQPEQQLELEQQENVPANGNVDQGNARNVQPNDNNVADRNNEVLDINAENANAPGDNQTPNEGGAPYSELTQSLTGVVEAMRNFLHNVRITEYDQQQNDVHNSDDEGNVNNNQFD